MRIGVALVLAFPVVFPGFSPALAAGPCLRPTVPACAESGQAFADTDSGAGAACRQEVEVYVSQILAHLQCLNQDHAESSAEMNAVVRAFNCRLAGRSDCVAAGSPSARPR